MQIAGFYACERLERAFAYEFKHSQIIHKLLTLDMSPFTVTDRHLQSAASRSAVRR
ncbi:hypothetical protein SBDP1_210002 [Syntrophobacter sp. SbD1]|nr:hypothetical protein SBDP1_210002 [Syntrophobacter sp. SbD1]